MVWKKKKLGSELKQKTGVVQGNKRRKGESFLAKGAKRVKTTNCCEKKVGGPKKKNKGEIQPKKSRQGKKKRKCPENYKGPLTRETEGVGGGRVRPRTRVTGF